MYRGSAWRNICLFFPFFICVWRCCCCISPLPLNLFEPIHNSVTRRTRQGKRMRLRVYKLKSMREERDTNIYLPIHRAPIFKSISCAPNNNTTITHMRQGQTKHIFLHASTFIQGPCPLLDDLWRRFDVIPFLPPLNFLGLYTTQSQSVRDEENRCD